LETNALLQGRLAIVSGLRRQAIATINKNSAFDRSEYYNIQSNYIH